MASIAGSLIRKKIIYHVHEVFRNPNILQKIMWCIMEMNATKIIVVSKYVNQYLKRKDAVIIYNMVSKDFEKESKRMIQGIDIAKYKYEKKNILMISSLRKYKGIDIFFSLARKCPGYSFVLVLSSSCKDIEKYFSYVQLPGNLLLLEQRDNLLSFYFDASIVINLSIPDLWIETFGMTLLEGLQFGTPCIAPDFGGPKEIIIDRINGFLINPYNEDSIVDAINTILKSEEKYEKYVKNALSSKELFDFNSLIKQLYYEINSIL
jgi:glycosyltransferase involved in cell wall biosynthesis